MKILNGTEIKKLVGTVIINGDESCIRSNAYIIRLGAGGEFPKTSRETELSTKKKGITIPQGQTVGVVALETLDFRRKTVQKIYPENDLCGSLWPTRILLQQGMVAPATHVEEGYSGIVNWMLTNTASVERRYLFGEPVCRLTFFKLEKDEIAEFPYEGYYQGRTGNKRSRSQENF